MAMTYAKARGWPTALEIHCVAIGCEVWNARAPAGIVEGRDIREGTGIPGRVAVGAVDDGDGLDKTGKAAGREIETQPIPGDGRVEIHGCRRELRDLLRF